jgi:hypothetical protein
VLRLYPSWSPLEEPQTKPSLHEFEYASLFQLCTQRVLQDPRNRTTSVKFVVSEHSMALFGVPAIRLPSSQTVRSRRGEERVECVPTIPARIATATGLQPYLPFAFSVM